MMYAPLYFGVHQGTFADEGFELEFMTMRTDLAIAALGTGDVDYILHGGDAAHHECGSALYWWMDSVK